MSSADAPQSTSTWKTFINDYKQKQRWAWGVSDLPLFIEMYFKKPNLSFLNKTIRIMRVVKDHVLWPVNWFVITVGVVIVTLINPAFGRTSLGYSLPRLSSGLLSITLVFLLVLLIVEYRQRPSGQLHLSRWRKFFSPWNFFSCPLPDFSSRPCPGWMLIPD